MQDFGIAKQQAFPGDTDDTETALGRIIGTISYMSPEQAQGEAVDARSDIFSFGCVLYEMITGVRAFDSRTNVATLAAILHSEPTPIRDLLPHAPPELEHLVARCLKKNSAERLQNMAELEQQLNGFNWEVYVGSAAAADHRQPEAPPSNRAIPASISFSFFSKRPLIAAGLASALALAGASAFGSSAKNSKFARPSLPIQL